MVTVSIAHTQFGWRFWFGWMAASILSIIVYLLTIPMLISSMSPLVPGLQAGNTSPDQAWIGVGIGLLGALTLGALIGLAQWLLLRRYLPQSGWWILATAIGYAIPLEFSTLSPLRDPPWLGGLVTFVLFGLALGVAQWLVLRRRMLQSEWWVAFTLLGWLLAFALTSIAYATDLYFEPFDLLSAFIVPIGTSGIGMVWLLRRMDETMKSAATSSRSRRTQN